MQKFMSNIYYSLLFGGFLLMNACSSHDPFLEPEHSGIPRTWKSPVTGLEYSLVFNDEFEGREIDKNRWGFGKDDFNPVTRVIDYENQKISIRVEDEASTMENGNLTLSVYRKENDSLSIYTGGIHTG